MSDDQFTKLFRYMQDNFVQLRDEMKQLEQKMGSRFDSIYGLLDNHVKQRELDEQERAAMGAQLTRHDKWIGQIANKTRTDLPY